MLQGRTCCCRAHSIAKSEGHTRGRRKLNRAKGFLPQTCRILVETQRAGFAPPSRPPPRVVAVVPLVTVSGERGSPARQSERRQSSHRRSLATLRFDVGSFRIEAAHFDLHRTRAAEARVTHSSSAWLARRARCVRGSPLHPVARSHPRAHDAPLFLEIRGLAARRMPSPVRPPPEAPMPAISAAVGVLETNTC